MLTKSQGIVLAYYKYSDTSIITHIFTEFFGIQTYILKGIRSSKAHNKISLFAPLSLLELDIFQKEGKEIHHLKEYRAVYNFTTIPFDARKSSICFFMAEVLHKTLKESFPNTALFQFLSQTIISLDQQKNNFSNLHLYFLIHYLPYLGYSLSSANEFEQELPVLLSAEEKIVLNAVIANEEVLINNYLRRTLLDKILIWYQTHFDGLVKVNSLEVLKEVFVS